MADLATILADLRGEHEALDGVLAAVPAERWAEPSPSPGWTVHDQVAHLAHFDAVAIVAIEDPARFEQVKAQLFAAAGEGRTDEHTLSAGRAESPGALHESWRRGASRLLDVAAGLDERQRIPWFGPTMSAKAFVAARLMETWAHGQDVVDAAVAAGLAVDRPATDRLVHVAEIGVRTRGWSYAVRGEEAPQGDVRVELGAPSGSTWAWGPEGAAAAVRGPAVDFCLVVTQRRHVDDTALAVHGRLAEEWMARAQAFAGAPTLGPAPRT